MKHSVLPERETEETGVGCESCPQLLRSYVTDGVVTGERERGRGRGRDGEGGDIGEEKRREGVDDIPGWLFPKQSNIIKFIRSLGNKKYLKERSVHSNTSYKYYCKALFFRYLRSSVLSVLLLARA